MSLPLRRSVPSVLPVSLPCPGDVEAIIINLVGGADFGAVVLHSPNDPIRGAADDRAQLRGAGEERPGFHPDDSEIFLARKLQIETALGLNHLAGTDLGRGPRDRPADVGIVKVSRKIKCVGEKNIAEQDAE